MADGIAGDQSDLIRGDLGQMQLATRTPGGGVRTADYLRYVVDQVRGRAVGC